jgi:hypothetical protein
MKNINLHKNTSRCREYRLLKSFAFRVISPLIFLLGSEFVMLQNAAAEAGQNVDKQTRVEKVGKYVKWEAKGKLVEGFMGVPQFPGSSVLSSYKKSAPDPKGELMGYQVKFGSAASTKEIMKFYRRELKKQGWKIDPAFPEKSSSLLAYRDGTGLSMMVEREDSDLNEIEIEIQSRNSTGKK